MSEFVFSAKSNNKEYKFSISNEDDLKLAEAVLDIIKKQLPSQIKDAVSLGDEK